MAETKNTIREFEGKLYVQISPGRAQALVQALDIALASGQLDKRIKAVVSGQRSLLATVASGKFVECDPACWVYIVEDLNHNGAKITKIGHARDVDKRFARRTDRSTKLRPLASWRFASVAEATQREEEARQRYPASGGDGGTEWVQAEARQVLSDLREAWGNPDRSGD